MQQSDHLSVFCEAARRVHCEVRVVDGADLARTVADQLIAWQCPRAVVVQDAHHDRLDLAVLSDERAMAASAPPMRRLAYGSDYREALRAEMAGGAAVICTADAAVAETGTLLFARQRERSRELTLLPSDLLVVVPQEAVHAHLAAAWGALPSEGAGDRSMVMMTGPSRTADIEKILILGAHGPKRLAIVVVTSSEIAKGPRRAP